MVQVGQPGPLFVGEAYVRGEPDPVIVDLSAYRGRWAALFFYPRDFTFICPTELQSFAQLHDQFDQEQAELLAASTDSYYCHKAWFESDVRLRDVRYPVIADTSHALSRAFGVALEDGQALRGSFLLDPEGTVRYMQVCDLNVGRNSEDLLRTLRALRTGELCPAGWQPGQATLTELMEERSVAV